MGERTTRDTFYRPQEVARERSVLPAAIYNALQRLLARSETGCVFIPIRSMQYQAILEREEIIFVDSQGGYAHQDGVGGRLIRIAWRLPPAAQRESLSEPVPCEVIHYFPDLKETQRRLVSEIRPVLDLLLQRQRQQPLCEMQARVVPLRR